MRFGILGPLAVWTADGQPVTIPGTKVRALLAELLLHPGQLLSADRLVDDLWSDRLPVNPSATLQSKVSQLRRALEDAEPGGRELVRYRAPGYALDVGPEAVDAGRFELLVGRAQAALQDDARQALGLLDEALGLWRGPALAEFVDELFARAAISHLDEVWLSAQEARIEARLALGQHPLLIGELEALVNQHPLRERLRGLHMRALYGMGRQAEALDSYQQLRARLRDELGLDPRPELGELHQAILEQDTALDAPPPAVARPARTNLPAPRDTLVGAGDAVGRVRELLASNRLVTLTGPGGVGKTRLALEAGRALVDRHPGGVWLVELGRHEPASADETTLAEEVSGALDVRGDAVGGEPVADQHADLVRRLAQAVGDQPSLLILDNCEHVLAPAARLVGQLLASAAALRVLATSRLPLALSGEQLWPVARLSVPDAGAAADPSQLDRFDAVRLFAARAGAATPAFAVTSETAEAVATICRRLDGLPLALELAAARLRALSVQDLAARLDDRFRVLATGPHDAPQRHHTLWATIRWSWELLSVREQAVLARLSTFGGAASLTAVETVCAGEDIDAVDVLDIVARLVDHSLVVADTGDGGTRYRLLETIRSYASERLEETGRAEPTRRRHAEFYADLAEVADVHLRGPDQRRWLERLDAESANLRAAADWATQADADLALRLANALAWYAYLRGRTGQACRQLARTLREDADPTARARAHAWLGSMGALDRSVGDPASHGRAALALYGELDAPADHAHAKLLLGGLLLPRRGLPQAERLIDEALETLERLGEEWGTAGALTVRGWLRLEAGDPATARRDGEAAHAAYRRLGDAWGQVRSAELLAQVAELHGEYDRAAELHRNVLQSAESLGLWSSVAMELGRLGRVALLAGEEKEALELHERALQLGVDLGFDQGRAFARVGLGLIARRQGRLDDAEEHLRTVLGWHRESGFHAGVAFCLNQLGFVAELRGDARLARTLHRDGLEAAERSGDSRALALAVEGLAGAAVADDAAEAATLLGAATGMREAAGAQLPPAERHDVDRIAAAAVAAIGEQRFTELFEQGRRDPDRARSPAPG